MKLIDVFATVKINGYVTVPLTIKDLNSENKDEIINDYISNLDFGELSEIEWKIQDYDKNTTVSITGYVISIVQVDKDNYISPIDDINTDIENMDFGPLMDINWTIDVCNV